MNLEDTPVKLLQVMVDWFKGQPFSNVMSFLQLALLAGLGWAAMAKMIPEERKAILDGLQKQEQQQTEQINRVAESFEKALDRITPVNGSRPLAVN